MDSTATAGFPPSVPIAPPAAPAAGRVPAGAAAKSGKAHSSGDSGGAGLSGGIIALIIIAIIVLVVLVAALAAFIQRQMDVKRSRRCVRPAAGGVPAGMSIKQNTAEDGADEAENEHSSTKTRSAPARKAGAVADVQVVTGQANGAVDAASAPFFGQSQPAATAAQQNQPGTNGVSGASCNPRSLVTQVQPGRLSGALTPSQLNQGRHSRAAEALRASIVSNAGTCSAPGNPNGSQQLRSINAALNAHGNSTVTTAGAKTRALRQATQSLMTPAVQAGIASTTRGNGGAMVGDVKGQYLVDLNNYPLGAQTTNGGKAIVPANTNDPGASPQTPTMIAQAFSGKPVDKGVTADMAKRMQYAYDITNFTPESSQFTSEEVAAQRANNLALQDAAARNPAMAAQYLAGVGASNPVTITGIKSAVARQAALGRNTLSRPVKGGYGFLDASIRPPLALPALSAASPTWMESTAAAYARASQSCTAAQI